MKHPQLAAVLFFAGIGCLAVAFFGESVRSVFLAVGILCLLLSYVSNQRVKDQLKVDPFTGTKTVESVTEINKEES